MNVAASVLSGFAFSPLAGEAARVAGTVAMVAGTSRYLSLTIRYVSLASNRYSIGFLYVPHLPPLLLFPSLSAPAPPPQCPVVPSWRTYVALRDRDMAALVEQSHLWTLLSFLTFSEHLLHPDLKRSTLYAHAKLAAVLFLLLQPHLPSHVYRDVVAPGFSRLGPLVERYYREALVHLDPYLLQAKRLLFFYSSTATTDS
jgi:hypothetical protein